MVVKFTGAFSLRYVHVFLRNIHYSMTREHTSLCKVSTRKTANRLKVIDAVVIIILSIPANIYYKHGIYDMWKLLCHIHFDHCLLTIDY